MNCTFERNFTVPPFKVTQGPRTWRKSIRCLWLPISGIVSVNYLVLFPS